MRRPPVIPPVYIKHRALENPRVITHSITISKANILTLVVVGHKLISPSHLGWFSSSYAAAAALYLSSCFTKDDAYIAWVIHKQQ